MTDAADFYTGFVADAYAALKAETFDADRYAAFVREHGGPALEVGCGDGHPLLDLVQAGLEVDGVDSSPDMIERATRAARARGLQPVLRVSRMEDMDLGRRYRSIYLAGPTFELLPDDASAARALASFRRHLHPEGQVMVPLWIPQPTPGSTFGRARRTTDPSGVELSFVALSEDLDDDTRTRRTQVRYERTAPGAPTETIEREWVIHWQTPSTIATLAEAAGLRLLHLDPAGTGRDTTLRPGAEFTAYLGHADRVPARRA